jgi:hypothetical protein
LRIDFGCKFYRELPFTGLRINIINVGEASMTNFFSKNVELIKVCGDSKFGEYIIPFKCKLAEI